MRYWRNSINPSYCPVVGILTWLLISGLGEANGLARANDDDPVWLFPSFKDGFTALNCKRKNNVNMVRRWFVEWFDATSCAMPETENWKLPDSSFHLLVPHSIRRTGCKWASECYAEEWQCLVSGRWGATSTSFRVYIQEGADVREGFVASSMRNPVFNLWVWRYGVVTSRRAAMCANAQRTRPRKRTRTPQ